MHGSAESNRILAEIYDNFSIAIEELHFSAEEIHRQNEELAVTRQELENERRRYEILFDFAPDAYLVTDLDGNIQRINHAAGVLGAKSFLIGTPLLVFIAPRDRKDFLELLISQKTSVKESEREFVLKSQSNKSFPASVKSLDLIGFRCATIQSGMANQRYNRSSSGSG